MANLIFLPFFLYLLHLLPEVSHTIMPGMITHTHIHVYKIGQKKGLQVLIGGVTRQRMMMEKQNSIIQIPLFFSLWIIIPLNQKHSEFLLRACHVCFYVLFY